MATALQVIYCCVRWSKSNKYSHPTGRAPAVTPQGQCKSAPVKRSPAISVQCHLVVYPEMAS